jgi:hypothetical protein
MELGIVVTDDRLLDQAVGLAEAARNRGWNLHCFLTDRGVLGLANARLAEMVKSGGVKTAICELSVERCPEDIPQHVVACEHVVVGGQYQDAELVRKCDRTIVL